MASPSGAAGADARRPAQEAQAASAASDATPPATRVLLLATLALTVSSLGYVLLGPADAGTAEAVAPVLWLLTGLFVLRVAGQIVVKLRAPAWLPPMEQWNLLRYSILLPVQILFVGVMCWIDVCFSLGEGLPVERSGAFGLFVIVVSAVYAAAMLVRYAVRMRRRPDQRWFGGTIPIVFHLVLATYLFAIGSFHAAG